MAKGYFAGFQYCEFTSGSVAAPTSPIAPARESGAMESEVTAVITGLNICTSLAPFWAKMVDVALSSKVDSINNFFIFGCYVFWIISLNTKL